MGAGGNNNDYNDKHEILGTLAMVFGATLFGGIHIGVWNFEFPSRIELIFWRCANVFSAGFDPAMLLLIFLIFNFANTNRGMIIFSDLGGLVYYGKALSTC